MGTFDELTIDQQMNSIKQLIEDEDFVKVTELINQYMLNSDSISEEDTAHALNRNQEYNNERLGYYNFWAAQAMRKKISRIIGGTELVIVGENNKNDFLHFITFSLNAIKYRNEFALSEFLPVVFGFSGSNTINWEITVEELMMCEEFAIEINNSTNHKWMGLIWHKRNDRERSINAAQNCLKCINYKDQEAIVDEAISYYILWMLDGEIPDGRVPLESEVMEKLKYVHPELRKEYINNMYKKEIPLHNVYAAMLAGDIYAGLRYAINANRSGEFKEAIEILEQVAEKEAAINDMDWQGAYWEVLGGSWKGLGELDKAIECYENCFELVGSSKVFNLIECANFKLRKGEEYTLEYRYIKQLEQMAFDGDSTANFALAAYYTLCHMHYRAIIFYKNFLKVSNEQTERTLTAKGFLCYYNETDENDRPIDANVLLNEIEKGNPSANMYLQIIYDNLKNKIGRINTYV